jgi:cobalt/nickel transport system permease protein
MRARVVLPLVVFVAVFVPFVRGGEQIDVGPLSLSKDGLSTFASVASKAAIGTVSAVLLGATTSFPDVLHGLERMRAPRLLVLIAAFMYRYLFVIADEARRMRVALAARGYRPRHALQAAAIGRVAISLFLRTYDRAERVYVAMLARGYSGSTPRLTALVFARADVLFLVAVGGALLPLRVLVEVAA